MEWAFVEPSLLTDINVQDFTYSANIAGNSRDHICKDFMDLPVGTSFRSGTTTATNVV